MKTAELRQHCASLTLHDVAIFKLEYDIYVGIDFLSDVPTSTLLSHLAWNYLY